MKNKKAILIILVVLVVLLASVLVGMLTSRQSDVEEPVSPTSKPTALTPVNTSMDESKGIPKYRTTRSDAVQRSAGD